MEDENILRKIMNIFTKCDILPKKETASPYAAIVAFQNSVPLKINCEKYQCDFREDKYFNEYNFEDVKSFLHLLDYDSDLYSTPFNEKMFFRGHQNSAWQLIPSAFRPQSGIFKTIEELRSHVTSVNFVQKELDFLLKFYKHINGLGIYIDSSIIDALNNYDSNHFIDASEAHKIFITNFLGEKHLPSLALAQHYGVPTRLLDLSHSPYISLFFAVADIDMYELKNKPVKDNKLCLWVIPRNLINFTKSFKHLKQIDTNHFQNDNIRMQQGTFINYISEIATILKEGELWDKEKDQFLSLDKYLLDEQNFYEEVTPSEKEQFKQIINDKIGKPIKLTLPINLGSVGNIILKLQHLNISWSTIEPNLSGAAREANTLKHRIKIS